MKAYHCLFSFSFLFVWELWACLAWFFFSCFLRTSSTDVISRVHWGFFASTYRYLPSKRRPLPLIPDGSRFDDGFLSSDGWPLKLGDTGKTRAGGWMGGWVAASTDLETRLSIGTEVILMPRGPQ
jgi:hypothetical protein